MNSETRTATAVTDRVSTEQLIMEVRRLSKHFPVGGFIGGKVVHALEDVSFSIPKASVVAVVGESGRGKSTTARVLARLTPPTSGQILYQGEDIIAKSPSTRRWPIAAMSRWSSRIHSAR